MDSLNSQKSYEDISKGNFSRKPDDISFPSKKKNSAFSFVEKRRNNGKSPSNPFMSRLNISSFLDLIVSDKNDHNTTYSTKNRKIQATTTAANVRKSFKDPHLIVNTSEQQTIFPPVSSISRIRQCPICANELPDSLMYNYTVCNHYACIDCWQSYVINRIESYEIGYGFTCLTCNKELPYQKVFDIINQASDPDYSKKLSQRLENFYLDRALSSDPNIRRCPNLGCDFAIQLIPDFTGCQTLTKCQLKSDCCGQLCGNRCTLFWKDTAHHNCKVLAASSSSKYSTTPSCTMAFNKYYQSKSTDDDIDRLSLQNHDFIIDPDFKSTKLPPQQSQQPQTTSSSSGSLISRCFPWKRGKRTKRARAFKSRTEQIDIPGDGNEASPSKIPITQVEIDDNASLGSLKNSSIRTKFHNSTEHVQSDGNGEIKCCPKCHTYVLKMNDGSCNHMVCVVCGCEFCWLCMRQITDMHYLSPSGCTFWGRRQWNVEKRALWQMGTLIGAPIAIGFLAALAIPAMVIGIPLYVGRKIHGALKTKNKDRKRTIAVAGGLGAFIVSPVIAAVAVGLGVPLILAYVYVVMPIALCRASACSCDDNVPIQEEVYFTDVAEQPRDESKPTDQLEHSPAKGDIEDSACSKIGIIQIETDSKSCIESCSRQTSESQNDCPFLFPSLHQENINEQHQLDAIPVKSNNYHHPKRNNSNIFESFSSENLRSSGRNNAARMTRNRYSDPITDRSRTLDEVSCSLQ